MTKVRSFLRDKAGATAIEYALIGGFISLTIVLSLTSIGTRLNAKVFFPLATTFGS